MESHGIAPSGSAFEAGGRGAYSFLKDHLGLRNFFGRASLRVGSPGEAPAPVDRSMKAMTRLVRLFGFLGIVCAVGLWGSPIQAQSAAEAGAEVQTTTSESAPAATAPPADTESQTATATATNLDGATYRVRLRDLEQRVDELKEKIRRSHTRLSLLSDTILAGAAGGAKAEIVLENDLSGAWRLVEAIVVFDGAVQYKKTDDTGVLAAQRKIPIFSGSIPAGDHTVQVLLKLRGHGFGVFSYLRGIEATVKNDYSFTLTDGKVLELRAIAWEQGGPTTPVEEQPTIRFVENIRALGGSGDERPAEPTPLTTPATAKEPAPSAETPPKAEVSGGASTSSAPAAPSGQVGGSVGAGTQ